MKKMHAREKNAKISARRDPLFSAACGYFAQLGFRVVITSFSFSHTRNSHFRVSAYSGNVRPNTTYVEAYQRRILAEAEKDRMSKMLMAKIIGVNEKLLRGWEKKFRDLPPPLPPQPAVAEVFFFVFL